MGLLQYESTIIPLDYSSRHDIKCYNSLYISSYSNEPLPVTVDMHVIIMIVISIATVAKDSLL